MVVEERGPNHKSSAIIWFVRTFVVLGGSAIWIAAPRFIGKSEPWDADSGYYWVSLVGVGFVAGLLGPTQYWWKWAPWRRNVGQIFGMLLGPTEHKTYIVMDLVPLVFCTAISLFGSGAGAALWVAAFKLAKLLR